jgi:hypothetical protein
MSIMESEPVIAVTDECIAVDEGDTVFGKRWASQLIEVSPEQLESLQRGKYLALDVQGEYIVYLQLTGKDTHV